MAQKKLQKVSNLFTLSIKIKLIQSAGYYTVCDAHNTPAEEIAPPTPPTNDTVSSALHSALTYLNTRLLCENVVHRL